MFRDAAGTDLFTTEKLIIGGTSKTLYVRLTKAPAASDRVNVTLFFSAAVVSMSPGFLQFSKQDYATAKGLVLTGTPVKDTSAFVSATVSVVGNPTPPKIFTLSYVHVSSLFDLTKPAGAKLVVGGSGAYVTLKPSGLLPVGVNVQLQLPGYAVVASTANGSFAANAGSSSAVSLYLQISSKLAGATSPAPVTLVVTVPSDAKSDYNVVLAGLDQIPVFNAWDMIKLNYWDNFDATKVPSCANSVLNGFYDGDGDGISSLSLYTGERAALTVSAPCNISSSSIVQLASLGTAVKFGPTSSTALQLAFAGSSAAAQTVLIRGALTGSAFVKMSINPSFSDAQLGITRFDVPLGRVDVSPLFVANIGPSDVLAAGSDLVFEVQLMQRMPDNRPFYVTFSVDGYTMDASNAPVKFTSGDAPNGVAVKWTTVTLRVAGSVPQNGQATLIATLENGRVIEIGSVQTVASSPPPSSYV